MAREKKAESVVLTEQQAQALREAQAEVWDAERAMQAALRQRELVMQAFGFDTSRNISFDPKTRVMSYGDEGEGEV